jgi:hypothetical protein
MKTRFESSGEIVALIDEYHTEISDIQSQIASKNHLADCLRSTEEAHRIPELRKRSESLSNGIAWREGRLLTLKDKLAEFKTPQIPAMDDGDKSIPS